MNPIRSLQHMLNHLARTDPALPRLAETGIFDEPTLEAVMVFQRDHELPVTGIVDQVTWDTITAAYYLSLFKTGSPPTLHIFTSGTDTVQVSEYNTALFVVQAMLTALSTAISNFEQIEFDGINTGSTTKNLRKLQALAQLEETGILDRSTWLILSSLYRALITRHPTTSLL